jgi:hypothetical protein
MRIGLKNDFVVEIAMPVTVKAPIKNRSQKASIKSALVLHHKECYGLRAIWFTLRVPIFNLLELAVRPAAIITRDIAQ